MIEPYRVEYLDWATAQLLAIEDYIADQDAPVYADEFTSRIRRFCDALGLFPHKHLSRDDIWPNLHTVGFEGSVLIAYVVDDDMRLVTIEAVFYGGQNWEAALKSSFQKSE